MLHSEWVQESRSDTERELLRAQPEQTLTGWIALSQMCADLFDRPRTAVTLGRYVVLGRLGAGGMGVVYSAYDPEMDRKVAIKVLPTHGGAVANARLLAEARAVAGVSHPNIVTAYDVGTYGELGTHPDGAGVFMVMELVDGVDIEGWLQRRRRSWREVLDAFVQAGLGLSAVHRAGLVHGDVKPSNMIVGADARVRLLDFGLAHASADGGGVVMGTPPFMAPEQHRGDIIDARADQFAWCVSLYRALYGRMPFAGEALDELEQSKREGAIESPTSRAPKWIHRVVVRGLAADPHDRFPDMPAALAELQRGSTRQRLQRWTLAGILGGGVAIAVFQEPLASECPGEQAWRASWDDDRRRTVDEALRAVASPLAEDAATRVQGHLAAYADEGARTHRSVCLAVRDRSMSDEILDRRIGCLRRRLAEMHAVTDVLASADATVVEHAIEIALRPAPIEQCTDDARLATSRGSQTPEADAIRDRLAGADVMATAGRWADALVIARTAYEESEALADPWLGADALARVGALEANIGDPEQALIHLSDGALRALEIGHDDAAAAASIELIYVLGVGLARTDDALWWSRHAQASIERIGLGGLEEARWRSNRGLVLFDRGDTSEAMDDLERALEIRTRLLGPDHPEVAVSLNNLGAQSASHGDFAAARRYNEEALAVRERILGAMHPHVAASLTNLGVTLASLGEHERAQELFERALDVARTSLGPEHPTVINCLANVGTGLIMHGRFREAVPLMTEGLALAERTLPADHPDLALAHGRMGTVLQGVGDHEGARTEFERALAVFAAFGAPHPALGAVLNASGESLRELGSTAEARERYKDAVVAFERTHGASHFGLAQPLAALGEMALDDGHTAEARELFTRALAVSQHGGVDDRLVASARAALELADVADERR